MSSFSSLLSGQIQLPNLNNTSLTTTSLTTNSTTTTTTSATQLVSDVNISPVNNTIDPSLYTYDGQTILYINSTVNQNNNNVVLQYFDPISGYPNMNSSMSAGFGFTNWNFDLIPQNYLNGCTSSSNMFGENTYLYDNFQPPMTTPNYLGLSSIDITDANQQLDSSGDSVNTMFFSLTSQPYLCYKGVMYNGPGSAGAPSQLNINPNYSSLGADTFMFTSQYWVQTTNEILIIQMVFSIANTASTYYKVGEVPNSSPAPIINVIVYNKVITREMLASVGTGNSCPKPKVYSTGTVQLRYLQTGQTFNSSTPSYYLFNNVPIVIADGFKKVFATFGLYYIPPSSTTNYDNSCQFLTASNNGAGVDANSDGYTIVGTTLTADISNINVYTGALFGSTTGIGILGNTQTLYGHFVVSVAYSYSSSQYTPGTNFIGEILIKNIWRSPIAIYNAYSAYSVNDLINKQVVLLFGKNINGGSFLVTNTGTPLAQVSNYGVTSLGNFMAIIKIIMSIYNNTWTLADYFINTTLINNINNSLGVNILPVTMQPVLDGTISNPPSVMACPNMWYMFLSGKNSANLSIDPTYQNIFNSSSSNYLGLPNSMLCDTGLCKYFNSELKMFGTSIPVSTADQFYFGNTLYLGYNSVNGQNYYMLIVLPEALFNGTPQSTSNNSMSIYAVKDTLFYFTYNSSSSSAFVPSGNSVSSTTSTTGTSGSGSVSNSYSVSKVVLPVSNVQLL